MDEEIRFHIELETKKNLRAGLSPAEARRRALLAFGGVEKHRETIREGRGFSWAGGVALDLKLGARMIGRYPVLTIVAGLSLAFGVAVCATTFELVTQILHPRLLLPEGDRVVAVQQWHFQAADARQPSLNDFLDWQESSRTLTNLGAFNSRQMSLGSPSGRVATVEGAEMTASGFALARTPPLLGRYLVLEDELPGGPTVVVLGHDTWQTLFAGDPAAVGQQVRVDGRDATVVGVMPEGFRFPVNHSAWIPFRTGEVLGAASAPTAHVFARLAPGGSRGQAEAEIRALHRERLALDPPVPGGPGSGLRPIVRSYPRAMFGGTTVFGYAINTSVLLFLVLACANVALLVFARLAARERELVVRSALGATRERIVVQLTTEALVLSSLGAVVGLAGAAFVLERLMSLGASVGAPLPFWLSDSLSPRTIVYAALLTILCALAAGVLPALNVTGWGVAKQLRGRTAGGMTPGFGRLWTWALAIQVGLTVVCLPIAADAIADTLEIERVFDDLNADEYLSAMLTVSAERAPGWWQARGAHNWDVADADIAASLRRSVGEIRNRLTAEPGIRSVTFGPHVPGAAPEVRSVEVEGIPWKVDGPEVGLGVVDDSFFAAFEAEILAGRGFRGGGTDEERGVVVVNESFVREVMAGRNPIGRHLRYLPHPMTGLPPGEWIEIVGIVADLPISLDPDIHSLHRNAGVYSLAAPEGARRVFGGHRVTSRGGGAFTESLTTRITLRTGDNPLAFAPLLARVAAEAAPDAVISDIERLDAKQREWVLIYSTLTQLGASASILLLLLAICGTYTIVSFTVARRTREIGIRVALGASRVRVLAPILRRALLQVALGIAVGILLVLYIRYLSDGIIRGGLVMVGGMALVVVACLAACLVPARRALSVQPTDAIRSEL